MISAARVIPFTGTRSKRPSNGPDIEKGPAGPDEDRPRLRVSLDLIDGFDENRMCLEAFLEGIYNTALASHKDAGTETIMIFCSMARERVEEMDKVFKGITEEGEKE